MRRRLPAGVRMYTGDDFNYAELIAGDDEGYSDALLGIFDAIAPAASAALAALGRGSDNEFFDLLEPTVPLSRHIFEAPTRFYKTGVVFLAYLNGLQDHFAMIGGQQSDALAAAPRRAVPAADKARVLRRSGAWRSTRMRASARGRTGVARVGEPDRVLSINLATLAQRLGALPKPSTGCLRHGITAIAPWRDQVAAIGLAEAARIVRANGLRVTGLCRGGMFPADTAAGRQANIDDNRRAIDEAAALGADCLVLVVGGLPGSSQGHRRRAADGARRHRRGAAACARRRRAARDRAAASDVRRRPRLREHARPGARPLRGARRGRRRRDRRLSRLVGPEPRRRDRARRPR